MEEEEETWQEEEQWGELSRSRAGARPGSYFAESITKAACSFARPTLERGMTLGGQGANCLLVMALISYIQLRCRAYP